MKRLSGDVKDGFEKDGLFTANMSEGDFNGVSVDYTLENKVLKG